MWRSKDFKNPYPHAAPIKANEAFNERWTIFEAGADAILKAIWKMAEESPTKTFTFDKNHFHVYREE